MKKSLFLFSLISLFSCLFPFFSCNVTSENFWTGDTNVNARFSGLLNLTESDSTVNAFKTSCSDCYQVLVITDVHKGAGFYRAEDEKKFFEWLDGLSASELSDIKFCLGLGDFADGAKESEMKAYAELVAKIEKKGIKTLNVVGNHDLYAPDGYEIYKKYCFPNTSYYRFESNAFVWYALDSGSGTLGSLQRKSLLSKLEDEVKTPVVFSHMPVSKKDFGRFWLPFCFRDATERNILIKLFSEKKIAGYFCGHYHPGGSESFGNFTQYNLKSFGEYGNWYLLNVDETAGKITVTEF